ncbi:helix-turn-helix domain-containing protein [Streptomyces sp. L7]
MAAAGERPLNEVQFLTVAEVASVMRVSKMTVYRLVHSGHLPAIRVGRSFRVPEQAVHEYLRESYVGWRQPEAIPRLRPQRSDG